MSAKRKSKVKAMPRQHLTGDELSAMALVKGGADVYSRRLAMTLREVEKRHPDLIDICKPMQYQGDGTDQVPFFGAILTAAGRDALAKAKGA